jgi:hypothetical protein
MIREYVSAPTLSQDTRFARDYYDRGESFGNRADISCRGSRENDLEKRLGPADFAAQEG